MIVYNSATGQKIPNKIARYMHQVCDLVNENYDPSEVAGMVSLLEAELDDMKADYGDWIETVQNLDAVPRKDFFLGADELKCFDVEEKIETDTDRAKVIVYHIHDKDLISTIMQRRKNKTYMILKFISPRVVEELVDVKRFYRKLMDLCAISIEQLKKCTEGVSISHGSDKSTNNKQEQRQQSAKNNTP